MEDRINGKTQPEKDFCLERNRGGLYFQMMVFLQKLKFGESQWKYDKIQVIAECGS